MSPSSIHPSLWYTRAPRYQFVTTDSDIAIIHTFAHDHNNSPQRLSALSTASHPIRHLIGLPSLTACALTQSTTACLVVFVRVVGAHFRRILHTPRLIDLDFSIEPEDAVAALVANPRLLSSASPNRHSYGCVDRTPEPINQTNSYANPLTHQSPTIASTPQSRRDSDSSSSDDTTLPRPHRTRTPHQSASRSHLARRPSA